MGSSFDTVVPTLLGPDKISDPENAELEYEYYFNKKYPADCPSVSGSFTDSLAIVKRHGPMKVASFGRTS